MLSRQDTGTHHLEQAANILGCTPREYIAAQIRVGKYILEYTKQGEPPRSVLQQYPGQGAFKWQNGICNNWRLINERTFDFSGDLERNKKASRALEGWMHETCQGWEGFSGNPWYPVVDWSVVCPLPACRTHCGACFGSLELKEQAENQYCSMVFDGKGHWAGVQLELRQSLLRYWIGRLESSLQVREGQ